MEFLAFLYTVLLVAICLMMALLLYRSAKPAANRDDAERKEWLRQQLEAQNRQMDAKLAEMAQQNLAAMGHISETLQASVQSMSTALAAGQGTQQQTMEQRLQGLEASNARKLEEMRRTLAEGMTALQAQNAQKLDEIRHTVDEQLQDALQKRVTESFKAVNDQLEQVYKGLGEMQNLAADVGGLKQVLSGVKTRGILGEIQLGAILEEILAPEQYDTNVATIPGSTQRVEYAIKMPGVDGSTVRLYVDGVNVTDKAVLVAGDGHIDLYKMKLANGTHSVTVSLRDGFDNETSETRYFTVADSNAENPVRVTSVESMAAVGGYVTLEIRGTSSNVSECDTVIRLDRQFSDCTVTFSPNFTAAPDYDAAKCYKAKILHR